MDVVVECHSGYTYADRPKAMYLNHAWHKVKEIITEWQTPEGKHFRLITKDENSYELIYDIANDRWTCHQL
jgi:hypothetical protein